MGDTMGLGSEFRIELTALRRELALLDVKKAGILTQIGAIQKMCSHSNTDTFRDGLRRTIYTCSQCPTVSLKKMLE